MKLNEIITTNHQTNHSDEEICNEINLIVSNGTRILQISDYGFLWKWENFIAFLSKDRPIGYFELAGETVINGVSYLKISIIHVLTSFRKTSTVGLFFIGLKTYFKGKKLLLSDSMCGGVLFADGQKLVKKMIASKHFDVKSINLKTGEISNITELPKDGKHVSLIFEEDTPPIIYTTAFKDFYIWAVNEKCK